jgi:excisionase family DNA binding protein
VTASALDAAAVADVLCVPVSWVREHTRSGAIPHVQLGRYVRYDLDEVSEWVESLKQGGGPRFGGIGRWVDRDPFTARTFGSTT